MCVGLKYFMRKLHNEQRYTCCVPDTHFPSDSYNGYSEIETNSERTIAVTLCLSGQQFLFIDIAALVVQHIVRRTNLCS